MMFVLAVLGANAATNGVPANVSQPASNIVVKAAAKTKSGEKASRPRCEAITKSGNRCSRKAAPGGEMCRQHLKAKSK